MQECLDAAPADNLDSGNNLPINWGPGHHVRWLKPSKEAGESLGFSRADFERILEDLHSFSLLELRA
jgi:hypothetical protein